MTVSMIFIPTMLNVFLELLSGDFPGGGGCYSGEQESAETHVLAVIIR